MKYSPIFETDLVRLEDADRLGHPARLQAGLHLLAVHTVEEHRTEPDDGAEDVQHEHELVEATSMFASTI